MVWNPFVKGDGDRNDLYPGPITWSSEHSLGHLTLLNELVFCLNESKLIQLYEI